MKLVKFKSHFSSLDCHRFSGKYPVDVRASSLCLSVNHHHFHKNDQRAEVEKRWRRRATVCAADLLKITRFSLLFSCGSGVGVCSVCRSLSAWRCISVVNIDIETLCLRLCERLLKHCFCPSRPPRGHTDTACCCDVLHCTEEPYHIVMLCYCKKTTKKKHGSDHEKLQSRCGRRFSCSKMFLVFFFFKESLESRGSEFFKWNHKTVNSQLLSVFSSHKETFILF